MKIESYNDLQPGDVWLGLMFIEGPTGCGLKFGIGGMVSYQMNREAVTALIDAGNDEVERKPESVTFETKIHGGCSPEFCDGFGGLTPCCRKELEPFKGERVEVTVRKL